MHSSTSNSDFVRTIPDVPWRGVLLAVALLSTAATAAWEIRARATGYQPTLNDTPDLWAQHRESVKPDSIVLSGTSRLLFDMDLDQLEKGLGQRPIQLSLAGSSPFPVLADLADDESFHGTLILDIVPAMFLAPAGPPMEVSQKALNHRRTWNHAQRWSHQLGMLLEEHVAFLRQEDLTLAQMLKQIPVPNRANAMVGPALPPYFYTIDRDRRARMADQAAIIGSPLQQRVSTGWLPLFSMPPPPSFIPVAKFQEMMGQAVENRFRETVRHIARIRARGGRVVFVRLPVSGPLIAREEQLVPLAAGWGRLVKENGIPAINFAEHADLNTFECPEWSHLSAGDSVEFTRRLVPHLQSALRNPAPILAAAGSTATAKTAAAPF